MATFCAEREREHLLSVPKHLMVYQPDRTSRDAMVHCLQLGTVQLHAVAACMIRTKQWQKALCVLQLLWLWWLVLL
jgi:hypothetical protein